jgi:hypothetical protein
MPKRREVERRLRDRDNPMKDVMLRVRDILLGGLAAAARTSSESDRQNLYVSPSRK